jgi:hypothetical protein
VSFFLRLHGRTGPSEKTLNAHQLNRCYKAMFCLSICIVGFNCFFSKRVVLLKANWESVIWDYFKKKTQRHIMLICTYNRCTKWISMEYVHVRIPVDGQWSSWTQWSSCASECGKGDHFRLRSCSNPEPACAGRMCPGNDTESAPCYLPSCMYIAQYIVYITHNVHLW